MIEKLKHQTEISPEPDNYKIVEKVNEIIESFNAMIAREHLTDGTPCWGNPEVIHVQR